jgi:hypothetical protein
MRSDLLGRALRLAFLLRIPLTTLALLAALGPIASGSSLLENLFDLGPYPIDAFIVSFSAFLLAYTAIACLNLTLYYGSDRLDEKRTVDMCPRHPLATFTTGVLAAAIFIFFVLQRTEGDWRMTTLYAFVGGLAATVLVIMAKLLQLWLTDPETTPHPPPYLVFPARRIPKIAGWLDRLYCHSSKPTVGLKGAINRISQPPLRLLRLVGQGYLITLHPRHGTLLKLRSGHVFAMSLSMMAYAAFLCLGWHERTIRADRPFVPALASVLLFLIVACWGLSTLTFFFDRYRFPLFAAVILLALITANSPYSDHFFRVERRNTSQVRFLKPAAYLEQRMQLAGSNRLIFVATPGGGIQAGAWTAQVLSSLGEREDRAKGPGSFRNAVALISSVSGGSLGSLIYAASFAGDVDPSRVAVNARASAIDEVAWGWTYPDFFRALVPWLVTGVRDRGWALEEKWSAVNGLAPGGRETMLSDWAARGATIPALIFNAMLVEPGRHVIFSTTDFPQSNDPRGIANFYALYPDHAGTYDIRVTTAARLSASFPYVAPAARSNLRDVHEPDFHYVDGGYYDNFGIDSLIGWLAEALHAPNAGPAVDGMQDILILTIRHFNAGAEAKGAVRGWGFQPLAPLVGLLSMWNGAPARRDDNEFRLFADGLRASTHGRRIWIVNVPYNGEGNCARAPLSWKLSESEKACIDTAWKAVANAPQLNCVDRYLRGDSGATECFDPNRTLQ